MSPFTTDQAPAHGLSPKTLRNGQARREHHGVYLEPGLEPSHESSVEAARLVLPRDALLDSVSALQALGVDVGPSMPLRFVTAHPHQVRRPGLRMRRVGTLPPNDGSSVGPAAAFVAAAGELDLLELVTARDWLVGGGHATADKLVAGAAPRGRGAVLARRAAGLVRAGVDSPRETQLRLCLVLAGVPEPDVNPVVVANGRSIGRVDLWWSRWRVAAEYEGDQHRTDPRPWNIDIRRVEQLVAGGAGVLRVTAARMRHPRAVVAVVLDALRAAGYDGPGPVFDEEWHRLFPSAR